MIALMLAVLALFVVQTFVPSVIRHRLIRGGMAAHLRTALGSRDDPPPLSPLLGRAQRAVANMQEALPVFLTLALLHVIRQTPGDLPTTGGSVFLGARTLYVLAYLSGIQGIRTALWIASWVGLGMMLAALATS